MKTPVSFRQPGWWARAAIVVAIAVAAFRPPTTNGATVTVRVLAMDFSSGPAGMPAMDPTIQVGDTIHWVWQSGPHSTTSAAGQAESWNSGVHNSGNTFDHTFTTPGVYGYYCVIHGFDAGGGMGGGMAGTVTVNPTPSSQLTNISTRLRVETIDSIGIGGFIITGGPKKVLIRARGPSLAQFNVPNVLADPTVELKDANGTTLAQNDNWRTSQQAEIQATGMAPSDDRESGIVITLPAGGYTALLSGVGGTVGVGIVEIFDLDTTMAGKLANVSTRGQVQTQDNVMIGGFIIGGTAPLKVIVRGIGPALTPLGVPGALQNPNIQLFDATMQLSANDDWRTSQQAEIMASGRAPTDDRESAIVATLMPGAYTVIVTGVSGTTGIGLVEVYALP